MPKLLILLAALVLSTQALAEPVWIDVRSPEEYAENHIPGDILIPHEQIASRVKALYPDKTTDINLYCRSGRRSGMAKAQLESAGYTNVSNAGGIADAMKKRGLTATESVEP